MTEALADLRGRMSATNAELNHDRALPLGWRLTQGALMLALFA
jgi:hypothetical protein